MRLVWWIVILLTALIAGAMGGLAICWVNSEADNPVVGWFGGWIKSPGAAVLGAVVAAGIGLAGISLQLTASRERDADAGWWQSFEWASDRGVPRNPTELSLSYEAAVDTLNALATAARTEIQRNAVGGVVDELLRSRGGEKLGNDSSTTNRRGESLASDDRMPDDTPRVSAESVQEVDESNLEGASSAVLRYALQQAGTAAESRRANASAYKTEVLRALKHQYGEVLPLRAAQAGDAIVRTVNRELVVEIKWSHGATLNLSDRPLSKEVEVVISNVEILILPPGVNGVVWTPKDASFALRRELDAIQ